MVDYINEKYDGSVVSVVTNPTDGYDASVNYDALNGTTISIAASPTPHAEILEVAKQILAAKGVTLDIQVYNDYVVPNTVVDDGTVTANYFQHLPYLEDFNAQNNTHIVSVGGIHVANDSRTRCQISSRGTLRFSQPKAASSPSRSRMICESGS